MVCVSIVKFINFRGEQARQAAVAAAEAAAQQKAAMDAVEAEHKQETVKEPSPVSQVRPNFWNY